MTQKPGGRALRFSATEVFAVDRVEFSWRARFPIVPPLVLTVTDEYRDGRGTLDVRLLSRRLSSRRGTELDVGEALRYLAELP